MPGMGMGGGQPFVAPSAPGIGSTLGSMGSGLQSLFGQNQGQRVAPIGPLTGMFGTRYAPGSANSAYGGDQNYSYGNMGGNGVGGAGGLLGWLGLGGGGNG